MKDKENFTKIEKKPVNVKKHIFSIIGFLLGLFVLGYFIYTGFTYK